MMKPEKTTDVFHYETKKGRNRMKKLIALLLSLMMCLGLFAGCGGDDTTVTDGTAHNDSSSSEGTTTDTDTDGGESTGEAQEVELWYYWETEGHQIALQGAIDDYNASQSDYSVVAKYVPFADFKKQLSIGAVASELPDMVIIDSPDHASYASMGIFADMTDKVDVSAYYEGPVASCTYDGKLYGVPFGVNCLALFYNEDMLTEAGLEVPTTWSELQSAAAALSDGTRYGFAFSSLQNEEGTFNFMPYVWSAGADYTNFNSNEGVEALTFAQELISSGAMSKECINCTQGDVMNQFISGNVAMMVNGCWQIPTMRSEVPDMNWGVSLIPMADNGAYASAIGGENFAVVEGGNVDGAISFLNYMMDETVMTDLLASFGYIAGIDAIAQNQFTGDEDYLKFVEQMSYAKARGPHENWPSISDAISLAFNQVMTDAATPADAAAAAQATIDSVLN